MCGNDEDMAWTGTGVGLIDDIRPAAEIVEGVRRGARDVLLRSARELGSVPESGPVSAQSER